MNFNLISWFHRNDSKEEILNFGLKTFRDKYLDTDTTFRKLKRRYYNLPVSTIQSYVQECVIANTYGVDWIQSTAVAETKPKNLINNKKFRQEFDTIMKRKFSWINQRNLSSIYKWTCYGLLFEE